MFVIITDKCLLNNIIVNNIALFDAAVINNSISVIASNNDGPFFTALNVNSINLKHNLNS